MTSAIKLYGVKKEPDLPSMSGYCQKVEAFLRASGYKDYTLVDTMPTQAPKGKIPYIDLERDGKVERIPDSHFIIHKLVEEKVVGDLDADLTPSELADSRAWEAWTDERLYPAVVYTRLAYDANYATVSKQISWTLPAFIRPFGPFLLRRNVLKSLWVSGIGRHSNEEVEHFIKQWVDSVDAKLEGDYFMGKSKPTLIDCVIYGFMTNSIAYDTNPEFKNMLLGSERIKKYVARLTKLWFPEQEKVLACVEK